MAEYTITPSNLVVPRQTLLIVTCGEAINAGQIVYRKRSDGKVYLAQSDGTEEEARAFAIAACSGATGQPIVVFRGPGVITCGSIFGSAGKVLALSATAGKAVDIADPTTSDKLTQIGITMSATTLRFAPHYTGVAGTFVPE